MSAAASHSPNEHRNVTAPRHERNDSNSQQPTGTDLNFNTDSIHECDFHALVVRPTGLELEAKSTKSFLSANQNPSKTERNRKQRPASSLRFGHRKLCGVAIVPLTLLGLLFSTTPAGASKVHIYAGAGSNIGTAGTEAGKFENPAGLAVNNSTHNIYIADKGNNRIDEFEANGTFVRAWGYEVNGVPGFGECILTCQKGVAGEGPGQLDAPEQIAIDNSGKTVAEDPSVGDVYVISGGVIDKFTSEGLYLNQITKAEGQPFTNLLGVAVDPRGTVWVAQTHKVGPESGETEAVIDDYSDALTNGFLASRETHGLVGGGHLSVEPGFAVDGNDDFYIKVRGGRMARFNAAGELLPEPLDAQVADGQPGFEVGAFQPGAGTFGNVDKTGVAVDPANNSVYLDMDVPEYELNTKKASAREIEALAADGAPIEDFGAEQLKGGNGGAVAFDGSNGTVYVADGGTILTYPTFTVPTVATTAPSNLQNEGSATLNATVDPEGLTVEECKFEYITDAALKQPNANEVQTITLQTPGEMSFKFEGERTNEVPENATAVEVQSVLEELPSLAGNVAVTGPNGGPYTVEFINERAHETLPLIEGKGGAKPIVTLTTEGGEGGWGVAKTANCEQGLGDGHGEIGEGTTSVPVSVKVSLTPDTLYHYRLKTKNVNGAGTPLEERVFVAPARPAIAAEKSPAVGVTEATLTAEVDPGGAPTTYYVEYGSSVPYSRTAEFSVGAGLTATGVQVQLSGLLPGTEYHYRFVASNLVETVTGAEQRTFTTPAAGGPSTAALPDDRAYELVTPPVPGLDQEVYVPNVDQGLLDGRSEHGIKTHLPFQVASDGEAVVYPGDPGPTGGTGEVGESAGSEFLATRSATGWASVDIQPTGKEGADYEAFSSDLSVGILESSKPLAEAAPAKVRDVYSHATAAGAGGEYAPLYTGAPPNRGDSLTSIAYRGIVEESGHIYFAGNAGTTAVPAFSDLLFEADDALLPGVGNLEKELSEDVEQEVREGKQANELYDSAAGRLSLVNVSPEGKAVPNASFGSLQTSGGTNLPVAPDVTRAISADGSRVFWTALEIVPGEEHGQRYNEYLPKALYVRLNPGSPGASTVLVAQGGEPFYWMANSEGSLVFYTTNTGDLYSFDVDTGQTTDLAPHGEVQGVLGSSENGEYVYFAADAVLATNKVNNGGGVEEAVSGKPNLYVSHDGSTTFIAGGEGAGGDWNPDALSARVTPDGHSIVFESNQSLTGYDNKATYANSYSTHGVEVTESLGEVFLYEAGPAKLHCVSCDPSGRPPAPTALDAYRGPVGGLIPTTSETSAVQQRIISDDGDRVFFESGEPLLPTDKTGWLGVYEWEADGAGTCASESQNGGCLYLLSGGSLPESSYLIGSDETGENVFFISRADLVTADRTDDDVVYDARVDGLTPPATEACEGTGCQGVPPAPPIFATPASVTFSGTGNFPPPAPTVVKPKPLTKAQKLANALETCKKDRKKTKRQSCEKQARAKYGPVKQKKAKKSTHTNRRTKS